MIAGRIATVSVLTLAALASAAGSRQAVRHGRPVSNLAACRATAPASATVRPAQWLGACPQGKAEGVGLMRFGAAEPYQFFFGERTPSTSGSNGAAACRIAPPVEFGAMPALWLGACRAGQAEGLGLLRAGTTEPFKFFAGEAHGGRPSKGLLRTEDGWFAATSFDPTGRHRDITSGNPTEYRALYLLAARAANATAQRFAAAGNRGSAGYYQRLSRMIADGEPA